LLLSGIWIYAIAVSKCKHSIILQHLLAIKQPLTVNLSGIKALKLTWRSPYIPHQICILWWGIYRSPKTPSFR
jgi:hypothetical protein